MFLFGIFFIFLFGNTNQLLSHFIFGNQIIAFGIGGQLSGDGYVGFQLHSCHVGGISETAALYCAVAHHP